MKQFILWLFVCMSFLFMMHALVHAKAIEVNSSKILFIFLGLIIFLTFATQ